MAQIALPVLLVGVAYLMSNDKEEDKHDEGFSDLNELKNQGNLLANENENYYPNISASKNNINNEVTLSQTQDKYFLENKRDEYKGVNEFETLAGNRVKTTDINHNNMNVFYKNKSNGFNNDENHSNVLDTYTGRGIYDIKKEEIAPLFSASSNTQNVYGNQNQNDFMQERIQPSQRYANTKPWEEIRDTPGIGMNYNDSSNMGLNNYMGQRDMYAPKTVDDLRATNNPKMVYTLHNHVGPALQPVQNRGIQGKIVKQSPDTTYQNNSNLGMIPQSQAGVYEPTQKSFQMMPEENRPSTSVEYFGGRGSNQDNVSYVKGEYMDSIKQQLEPSGPLNMSNTSVNPTSSLNYGKESHTVLANNRATTDGSYFGNIGGMISNVVEPIVNGLRHSKKTNASTNSNPSGYLNGGYKQPVVYNPNEQVDPTHREMYEEKLSMKHLNVQKQDSTAYMNTRPLLNDTQRISMNQDQTGPAQSSNTANKNYEAEYNQRNNENRLHASDVKGHGNMSLFNNKVKILETSKEANNNRQTPFYNPQMNPPRHPTEMLGEFTHMPQTFEDKTKDSLDSSLLQAFKKNPYTHSLHSAI